MKKLLVTFLAMCCCLSFVGCSSEENTSTDKDKNNASSPKEGGTYIMSLGGDPQNFNPNSQADDYAYAVNKNVYNRLVKINSEGKIIPDLAKEWSYSDDNKELTFNLYEGVVWHDGTKFTSEDVKWTFDEIKDKNGFASASLSNVKEVVCIDENTITFKLENPDASTLGYIAWYGTFIMPKHIYEGTDWTQNPANYEPIGTGPFKFVSHEKGVAVTLEKNEDYFIQKPYLDKLVFSIIPDQNTAFQSFLNGDIDETGSGIPYSEAHRFDNDSDYVVTEAIWANRTYLTFNTKEGVFKDPKVREAVTLGVDRDEIFEKALKGIGQKAEYYISPLFDFALNDDAKIPERDVEKARKLLEEAGYEADEDGMYMSVTLDTFSSEDVVAVVKENLKEIGIDVKINQMEMAAYTDKVLDNKDFEMTMIAGYQGPDIAGIANRISSTGTMNLASYNNEKIDTLIKEGNEVTEEAERAEKYKELQSVLLEDKIIVPLVENGVKKPIPSHIKGHPYTESLDKAGEGEFTYVWIDK